MVEEQNHKWRSKGDGWSTLEIIDLNKLSIEQSFKVQEMFDNKMHQRFQKEQLKKQDKLNITLLTATIILALVGISGVFNVKFPYNLFTTILVGLVIAYFTIKLGYDLIEVK